MPCSNRLDRIDVIVHSDPQWWQIAAALAPLVLALALVAFAVWYAVAQRRALPWSRSRQALDVALDEGREQRSAGLAMLEQLSTSRGLREVDAEIIADAKATLRKP